MPITFAFVCQNITVFLRLIVVCCISTCNLFASNDTSPECFFFFVCFYVSNFWADLRLQNKCLFNLEDELNLILWSQWHANIVNDCNLPRLRTQLSCEVIELRSAGGRLRTRWIKQCTAATFPRKNISGEESAETFSTLGWKLSKYSEFSFNWLMFLNLLAPFAFIL